MGRGRRGPLDQSTKKPKISKYKQRGVNNWQRLGLHHNEKQYSAFLLEDFLAEMKQMSPQNLMNIFLPNKFQQGN